MNSHSKSGMPGIRYQYETDRFEILISTLVIAGSSVSKSLKIFSNAGTILIMMKVKMPTATVMTTTTG